MATRLVRSTSFHSLLPSTLMLVVCCSGWTPAVARRPLYRVVELEPFPPQHRQIIAISEAGHVIGNFDTGLRRENRSTVWHGFIWYDGVFQDLGALDGPFGFSEARAVNSSGHVVGTSSVGSLTHAVLWLPEPAFGLPAGLNDLDGQLPYGAWGWDINERSEVVGRGGHPNIFLWLPNPAFGMPAGMNDLYVCDPDRLYKCIGDYLPLINELGQVIAGGNLWTPWPAYGQAAGWSERFSTEGGKYTLFFTDFTSSGLIVGNWLAGNQSPTGYQYYVHSLGDHRAIIGRDFSEGVLGANEAGDLVGFRGRSNDQSGFLKRNAFADDDFLDLDDLLIYSDGWHVWSGVDINNHGQIVGIGFHPDRQYRAVMLLPIDTNAIGSGRVDLYDFDEFYVCLGGPGEPVELCDNVDFESDGDVDLKDFQALQLGFEGSD